MSHFRSERNYLSGDKIIKLFNTLSGKKEPFIPIDPKGNVKIYICGLTPQDKAHFGHGLKSIRFDFILRYLKYSGFKTKFVENVTDIDDKIIARAATTGEDPTVFTREIVDEFYRLLGELKVLPPDRLIRVSQALEEIKLYAKSLIDKGFAYATSAGNVYFSVSKFSGYGKLSKQDLSALQSGGRVESEPDKIDPLDFALWKKDDESSLAVESEWGRGRPGWHIECSAMIDHVLGAPIDIHGGGLDLKFPHHENEIAQSEAHNNCQLAKYWIHTGLLIVDGVKMSKSLGNFITLAQAVDSYGAPLLRYLSATTHYSAPLNFSEKFLAEHCNSLWEFFVVLKEAELLLAKYDIKIDESSPKFNRDLISKLKVQFEESMDDDFNTAATLVFLRSLVRSLRELCFSFTENDLSEILTTAFALREFCEIIGFIDFDLEETFNQLLQVNRRVYQKSPINLKKIKELLIERIKAREGNDFKLADSIRDQLKIAGLEYLDRKNDFKPENWFFLNLRFVSRY
ncbi:MAG TPA: cysteine--tRNA ligase [Oligoflexia bacterium]|nr:cysteine--tRNA ligase [Oligoflexia bacterium]HMP26958.1 cysteine--tRNA ligase [Oligoflexia bacterium]